jgi:hypothetical protein
MRHDGPSPDDDPIVPAMKPIASRVLASAQEEGAARTAIPFLSLVRWDRPTDRRFGVLTPPS